MSILAYEDASVWDGLMFCSLVGDPEEPRAYLALTIGDANAYGIEVADEDDWDNREMRLWNLGDDGDWDAFDEVPINLDWEE